MLSVHCLAPLYLLHLFAGSFGIPLVKKIGKGGKFVAVLAGSIHIVQYGNESNAHFRPFDFIQPFHIDMLSAEGLIDAAMSGDSLTVRSFKSVIEGYLAPVFARAEVVENRTYRLEGTLEEPQMIAENRAR